MHPRAATLLRRLPTDRRLPWAEAKRAGRILGERTLAPGEVLFRQGDPAEGMYLLVGGSLVVCATSPAGGELPLGRVCAGEVVGEMGLLEDTPRAATARCERACTLLAIDRDTWTGLVASDDPLARWILECCARGLALRIQAMTERIAAAALDPATLRALPSGPAHRGPSWWAWLFGEAGR